MNAQTPLVSSDLPHFITRHPVLDKKDHVLGFELSWHAHLQPENSEEDEAHDERLLKYAVELGHQRAFDGKLTFVSISQRTLFSPQVEHLPKERVVLALHQTDALNPDVIARAEALERLGFVLAVNEVADRDVPNHLLGACHYVRLDTTQFDVVSLAERAEELRRGPLRDHQLMATHVDTPEVYETCEKLGFDLFQGYYFTRIEPTKPSRVDASVLRVSDILNKIAARAEFDELEAGFKLDPALSYKLLRYINSPAIGLRSTIKSIGHALTMLGYDQTYRWLTLLLFSSAHTSARNLVLLRNALARAHFTETLGHDRMGVNERGGLFIVGMFSLLDALLNIPMSKALADLNLPSTVADALIHGDGPYAPYLKLVIACEHADQETLAALAKDIDMNPLAVNQAHVTALVWSESVDV